jgi:energy-coupling factor transport system ATP-binding protein
MSCRIVVENVYFEYVPGEPVLRDVSLQFDGGTTAIIGQNGAGKTTLMKLLNGLLKPTQQGNVWVGDLNTRYHEAGRIASHVGLVFQNPDDQIFKSRVLDEVMFGPLNIGMSEREARESALAALKTVELEDFVDDNPFDLSYAQRKSICIASVLAMQTPVVVFDEPTVSQDAYGLHMMGRIIQDLKAAGRTVIAIVHDMNFAAEYFDRIVVMADGQVVADGLPEDVFVNQAALCRAHVDAPAMVKLSQATWLSRPCLTVPAFVERYLREKIR